MKKIATLSTEVQSSAVAEPLPAIATLSLPKPEFITICEPTATAFGTACYLARNHGYVVYDEAAPEIYGSTGYATIAMRIGSPDRHCASVGEAAIAHAVALRQVEFEKAVAAAALVLKHQQEHAAQQAKIEAEIEQTKLSIRRLQAQLA